MQLDFRTSSIYLLAGSTAVLLYLLLKTSLYSAICDYTNDQAGAHTVVIVATVTWIYLGGIYVARPI